MTNHNLMKRRIIDRITILLLILVIMNSCAKEYTDPSGANADDVLNSPKGLTGVVVGLQRSYTVGRLGVYFNSISVTGFTTNEIRLMNSGNIPELQLFTGGNSVDGTNNILTNLWTYSNKIIFDADNVIRQSENLADRNYAAGLVAYASLFKALALGNLSQYWEKIPSGTGQNVSFIDRIEGFNRAIATIDNAFTVISANPISTNFLGNMPEGIDIQNSLHAIKARYALFAGNYALALSEANLVDLAKRSTFNFDVQTSNPIFEIATSTNNVFQPTNADLGLTGEFAPDPEDKRLSFYTDLTARLAGFGSTRLTAIPVYLPGEMILIRAEAYARHADLINALIELNKVVTKTPANDPFGVGADLPPIVGTFTAAQILALIYKHRSIELYLSGLKLEDMRRFGLPTSDRKRNFFPYPFTERDNNVNTPPDPVF